MGLKQELKLKAPIKNNHFSERLRKFTKMKSNYHQSIKLKMAKMAKMAKMVKIAKMVKMVKN